ncbi:MAG: tRNA uracil 4-sulfurtransferase ThiI [Candidatus Kuenenbacteria bacterium]
MQKYILIRYGEIALKGKNQRDFKRQLKNNIEFKLKNSKNKAKVIEEYGYFLIETKEDYVQDIYQALKKTPGIVWYSPAIRIQQATQEKIREIAISQAKENFVPGWTFNVKVSRADKKFPLTSPELARYLGGAIRENTKWDKVDLKKADHAFHININQKETFIYNIKIEGLGGLPVGTAGRSLVLLSGGIDSPVAAYLLARRGCQVDFIHFAANLEQHFDAKDYKINELAKNLSCYTLNSRLYVAPYQHFRAAIAGKNASYEVILFRRFMMRVAQKLAEEKKIQALATGDNLSQVASQTMENLISASQSIDMPIFRPLLTYDKQEIIDIAIKIGTYDLSIQPYEDCCALVSKQAKTKSEHQKLEKLENRLFNTEELIKQTLKDIRVLEYRDGKLI